MEKRSWVAKLPVLCLVVFIPLGMILLSACGGSPATSTPSGPVTLTFWTWVPHIQDEVNLFQKAHPNIKVKVTNMPSEYTKLRTALKAGSGAPDVAQMEFQYLPSFILTGKLVDLSQYGANDIKNDYVPWAWSQVSQGSKIFAIPQDSGPMGMLYRQDLFDQYHIPVPQTWDQFAQAAATLHKANPKIYMTDFAPESSWFNALAWQAGSRPFKVDGTNVSIHVNDDPALKVADYWTNLIQQKVVATDADFTNDWYSKLDNGTYATWITAAWGPVFLSNIAPKSAGKWRAAPLPQWNIGDHASANWGGSTNIVTTQSKHPQEAAALAIWLNHDQSATKMFAQKQFLFPVMKNLVSDPALSPSTAFYGGQKVNTVFAQASNDVDTTYQWSPFQDYVYSQMGDVLNQAIKGKITLTQALQQLQSALVNYARSQGFTVV